MTTYLITIWLTSSSTVVRTKRQDRFPFVGILGEPAYQLLHRREHEKFFAHLLDEPDALKTQIERKILPLRHFDKLPDNDGGEKEYHGVYHVVGAVHR